MNGLQGGAAGFNTGEGEKLSNSQAAWLSYCAWLLLCCSPSPVSNLTTPVPPPSSRESLMTLIIPNEVATMVATDKRLLQATSHPVHSMVA